MRPFSAVLRIKTGCQRPPETTAGRYSWEDTLEPDAKHGKSAIFGRVTGSINQFLGLGADVGHSNNNESSTATFRWAQCLQFIRLWSVTILNTTCSPPMLSAFTKQDRGGMAMLQTVTAWCVVPSVLERGFVMR